MNVTVRYRGTRENLSRLIARAVKKATRDRTVLDAAGQATLRVVHEAFLVKVAGGTDAAGLRWQELAPATLRKKLFDRILVDGGDLERSLAPGVVGRTKLQVFRRRGNAVTVGTRRPFALAQHEGIPGRLPQRRLWPRVRDWPAPWWRKIAGAAKMEVVKVIQRTLQGHT